MAKKKKGWLWGLVGVVAAVLAAIGLIKKKKSEE